MENGILKSIRNLLILLLVGVFSCAFFLFDNYKDKLKIKNAIDNVKAEQDAINHSVESASAAAGFEAYDKAKNNNLSDSEAAAAAADAAAAAAAAAYSK